MSYLAVKHFHISFAALSGTLFLLRGILMLRRRNRVPLPQKPWLKRSSYLIDTVLLVSALIMVAWSARYPFVQPWLTVKVIAVVAYIIAGVIALKRGKTKTVRAGAFVTALLLFGYIVKLAVTKQVL